VDCILGQNRKFWEENFKSEKLLFPVVSSHALLSLPLYYKMRDCSRESSAGTDASQKIQYSTHILDGYFENQQRRILWCVSDPKNSFKKISGWSSVSSGSKAR